MRFCCLINLREFEYFCLSMKLDPIQIKFGESGMWYLRHRYCTLDTNTLSTRKSQNPHYHNSIVKISVDSEYWKPENGQTHFLLE